MPYRANETRRHKIPRARYRVENWSAYDTALRRRGDLTIWVTPEAIAAWTPAKTGRRGRPVRYSDIAIEAGVNRADILGRRVTEDRYWSVGGVVDCDFVDAFGGATLVSLDVTHGMSSGGAGHLASRGGADPLFWAVGASAARQQALTDGVALLAWV